MLSGQYIARHGDAVVAKLYLTKNHSFQDLADQIKIQLGSLFDPMEIIKKVTASGAALLSGQLNRTAERCVHATPLKVGQSVSLFQLVAGDYQHHGTGDDRFPPR